MPSLTKRLERILETAKAWPVERQEAAADMLEQMDRLTTKAYQLSPDELADIEEALAEVQRGEFASDAEVAAMFARHGQSRSP